MAETIITDKAMQAKPGATDIWLIEAGARGAGRLVGRITPSGERLFYFRYTGTTGDRVRLPIGPYEPRGDGKSAFTVQQARDKAREWSVLHRNGTRDLREHFEREQEVERLATEQQRLAQAQAVREAQDKAEADRIARERRMTVEALFERWRDVALQPRLRADGKRTGRKDGGQYIKEQFARYVFPSLGARAVGDVTRADVMAILDEAKAAGKLRTCNVLLADLKQMFAFALTRDIVERNPLEGVTRSDAGGIESSRERTLSPDEIRALARQLPSARLNKRSEAAIWLILSTACRVGELMSARWEHVDLVARTWYLPETKNERDHTIHLSDLAVAQFERLQALQEVNSAGQLVPWVFPASRAEGPVCIKTFGKQISDRQRETHERMSRRAKNTGALCLPGGKWTAHDLRRTAATLMASLGISGDVIDECLNHVIESRVRRTYIRDRRPQDQARAFDALGAKLVEIISGAKASSNVFALHTAA